MMMNTVKNISIATVPYMLSLQWYANYTDSTFHSQISIEVQCLLLQISVKNHYNHFVTRSCLAFDELIFS